MRGPQVRREAGEGQPVPSKLLQMQSPRLPGEEDCRAGPSQRPSVVHKQQGEASPAWGAFHVLQSGSPHTLPCAKGTHSHTKPGAGKGSGMGAVRLQGRNGKFSGRPRAAFVPSSAVRTNPCGLCKRYADVPAGSMLAACQGTGGQPAQTDVSYGRAGKRAALPTYEVVSHRSVCNKAGAHPVECALLQCCWPCTASSLTS